MEENFIREIEEDLRNEKFKNLWAKYGRYIIAVVAIVVLSTVGNTVYKSYYKDKSEKATGLLIKASKLINEEKTAQAQKIYDEMISSSPSDFAAIANIKMAAIAIDDKNRKLAAEYFAAAAKTADSNALADFADINAYYLNGDFKKPVAKGNIFASLAVFGYVAELAEAGKIKEARTYLAKFENTQMPQAIRERMRYISNYLDQVQK